MSNLFKNVPVIIALLFTITGCSANNGSSIPLNSSVSSELVEGGGTGKPGPHIFQDDKGSAVLISENPFIKIRWQNHRAGELIDKDGKLIKFEFRDTNELMYDIDGDLWYVVALTDKTEKNPKGKMLFTGQIEAFDGYAELTLFKGIGTVFDKSIKKIILKNDVEESEKWDFETAASNNPFMRIDYRFNYDNELIDKNGKKINFSIDSDFGSEVSFIHAVINDENEKPILHGTFTPYNDRIIFKIDNNDIGKVFESSAKEIVLLK